MGTNCAPLLADLYLYSNESEFLQTLVKDKKPYLNKTGKTVVKAAPNSVKQMSKTLLRHTLTKNIFDIFVDTLSLYIFTI
jgi:hypothetical protein